MPFKAGISVGELYKKDIPLPVSTHSVEGSLNHFFPEDHFRFAVSVSTYWEKRRLSKKKKEKDC